MKFSNIRTALNFGIVLLTLISVTFGIYLYKTASSFTPSPVYAASCGSNCPSGWSSCYSGTMCCYDGGGGCPTYMCKKWCDSHEEPSQQAGCNTYATPAAGGSQYGYSVSCQVLSKEGWHIGPQYIGKGGCQGCESTGGGGLCCKKSCPAGNGVCGTGLVPPGSNKYWCKNESQCSDDDSITLKCSYTREVSCKKSCTGKKGGECEVSKKGTVKYDCITTKCYASSVQGPISTAGASGTYSQDSPLDIVFQWGQPKSWGNVCSEPCNAGGFRLYVDGSVYKSFDINTGSYGRKPSAFSVGVHTWYIQAYRTGDSSANSATRMFTITSPDVTVRGYLWDATGTSCSGAPNPNLEIPSAGVTVKLDGTKSATVDQNPGTPYTYRVADVKVGSHFLAVAGLPDPPTPNSFYKLACVNGNETGSANFVTSSDPTTVNLGYRISSTSPWLRALNGNIHANHLLSFSREAPSGDFQGQYLISARGGIASTAISDQDWLAALYPEGNLSVTNNTAISAPTYAQMASLFGRGAVVSATIPSDGTLVNGGIYRVNQSDVVSGVYNVPSGVRALIFVDGTLTISGEVRTPANAYLAFIVRDNIRISKSLSGGGPDSDSLQATLIAGGAVNTAYNRTSSTEVHRQLVVDGNVISLANMIFFYRNLSEDDNTTTPAEIIQPRISAFIRAKNILAKPRIFWREIPAGF